VLVPPAVRRELERNPHGEALRALTTAFQEALIQVRALTGPVPIELADRLDLGEAEALALARETNASLVLLDDSAARERAGPLAFKLTGVLGVLRHAKQAGCIPSLKHDIQRLRAEARFFIHPALESALLISVGER
jgi:predicted nucleic acid-binding protein